MADQNNKYSGLPGIAAPDEKDVYETEDLPEADQDALLDETESANIERPHIDVRAAHDKFRGKRFIFDSDSDSNGIRRRSRVGYNAVNGEWEIAAEGEPETLQQRRHRLEVEFRLLIEDLNKLKEADSAKDEGEAVLASSLVPELEASLRQISQLQVPDFAGDLTATPDQHMANIQNLIKHLNEGEKKKSGGKGKTEESLMMTYQLNMYPAQANFVKSARLADLELRLKQLESVLGATPENLNRLALCEMKTVSEAVNELTAKANLLDVNTLDAKEKKLAGLIAKMDTIVEKRGGQQLAELEAKVNELYESYKKVETLSQSLFPIADRLSSLSSLHQEAGDFKKTLDQLKLEISNLSNKISADDAVLDSVQTGMKDLMDSVTKNITHLNTRLATLQK